MYKHVCVCGVCGFMYFCVSVYICEQIHACLYSQGHQVFHQASHSSQIRPMFEVTQRIILPAMEELLERSCSLPLVDATLVGLRDAIHIACIFSMEKERGEMLGMLAVWIPLSAWRIDGM